MNKGGKFLKKLWFCVVGGVGEILQDNLVLSIELRMYIGHRRGCYS